MELNGAKILYTIHTNIPLLGDFKITQTLVSTWIVMALLSGLAIWLGHGLKEQVHQLRDGPLHAGGHPLHRLFNGGAAVHFQQEGDVLWELLHPQFPLQDPRVKLQDALVVVGHHRVVVPGAEGLAEKGALPL